MSQPERNSGANARQVAADAVREVARGRSLDSVWPQQQQRLAPREQAFARELVSGTLRWYVRLDFFLARLARRPPGDDRVRAVILTGLYQLTHTRVAEHAAISESVEVIRALGRPRAAGFVNAVLRRYQRERDVLARLADDRVSTRHAYPQWFCERVQRDWPGNTAELLAAGNARAPMWLRVNQRRIAVDDWLDRARAVTGMEFARHEHAEAAVRPAEPLRVDGLPGFDAGEVSVQDAGAQLAAPLLGVADGMRVLDACAAPGGKSAHLLEQAAVHLTAVDADAARLERLGGNLARLGLAAQIVHGDAADPSAWWDGVPFDRILLDVPCSSSGVVRRHPDIKLLRRPGDIAGLASRQRAILEACFALLARGGRLVYCTCSIFAAENREVVDAFVASGAARNVTPRAHWGGKSGNGRQIMTGEAGMDGFYYSCLEHA